jgi:hypothetical protein
VSVWLAIGLIVIGLFAVALVVLVVDVARGDVGGGRHTMERARRILVVATDDETRSGAENWIAEQRHERPSLQCFQLVGDEGQDLYMAIEELIERERPDAVVIARHARERRSELGGTYGRLKEELQVPVDAIYVGAVAS